VFFAAERLDSMQSFRAHVTRPDAGCDDHLPRECLEPMCLEPSGPNADSTSFKLRAATFRSTLCRLPSQTFFMVLIVWGRSRSRMQGCIARVEALRCTVMILDSSE
jgi:hypothetical protein